MTGNAQGKVITKIKQEAKNSEKEKKKLWKQKNRIK